MSDCLFFIGQFLREGDQGRVKDVKNPPGLVTGAGGFFAFAGVRGSYTPGRRHVATWQRVVLA